MSTKPLTHEEIDNETKKGPIHVIRWMQERFGLLKDLETHQCRKCGTTLQLQPSSDDSDGVTLRCVYSRCKLTICIKKKSALKKLIPQLTFDSWIHLFLLWEKKFEKQDWRELSQDELQLCESK